MSNYSSFCCIFTALFQVLIKDKFLTTNSIKLAAANRIQELIKTFSEKRWISRDDLLHFYHSFEPDLKTSTFNWRIYSLKEQNVLETVGKGLYSLALKPIFQHGLEPRLKEISNKISKQYPIAKFCVWSTQWLTDLMIHQPGKFLLLVEPEPDAGESVFYFLRDNNYSNVYFHNDISHLDKYIYNNADTVIVKPLLTKAPLEKQKKYLIPSLEKILVDLYCDKAVFASCQGSELIHIFNNAYKKYRLNISRLSGYARRRGREAELKNFILKNTDLKELIQE